ncbi:hypothetical protein [Mobiluncus curtisii]|uniref:Uncharacterized protein n=1 Tax=Mobiluncus curtisii TaxID=2051 RepID=A0A2X3DVF2_9ACTO|nr:hypothetical protein [Mobiluncus curtisii]SQC02160.1 Uncharacterised protein [Mobiluncus curtisii]
MLGNLTLPGDPNAGLSLKELLGQPVSNMAAATILSPKEIEDSDGLQMRAVGLAVGAVPKWMPAMRFLTSRVNTRRITPGMKSA